MLNIKHHVMKLYCCTFSKPCHEMDVSACHNLATLYPC